MLLRFAPCFCLLGSIGCRQLAPTANPPSPAAVQLWTEGQLALQKGEPSKAQACFQQGLTVNPRFAPNHLSLAATCLEGGDEDSACVHLAHYVASQPDQLKARAHYAELLLRLHRWEDARKQFERYDADAQERDQPANPQLIRCHSQLTKIALEEDDYYREHLHRGIGLFLLGQERAALPDPNGDLPAEGLLFRASVELRKAHRKRPEEARPCWYLYEVWSQLGRRQPAMQCLRETSESAPFSYLTPAERRNLQVACLHEQASCAKRTTTR